MVGGGCSQCTPSADQNRPIICNYFADFTCDLSLSFLPSYSQSILAQLRAFKISKQSVFTEISSLVSRPPLGANGSEKKRKTMDSGGESQHQPLRKMRRKESGGVLEEGGESKQPVRKMRRRESGGLEEGLEHFGGGFHGELEILEANLLWATEREGINMGSTKV